jgi:hypothetical protein
MMALLELQEFCKAHNFKMIVANAFNNYHPLGLDEFLKMQTKSLSFLFSYNFNPNFYFQVRVRILLQQLLADLKNLVLVLVF